MRQSFYLCVSCLLQNVAILIYPPIAVNNDFEADSTNAAYCVFQATFKTSFDLSSILWTCIIMFNIFATVVKRAQVDRFEPLYLVLGYLFPIVMCLVYPPRHSAPSSANGSATMSTSAGSTQSSTSGSSSASKWATSSDHSGSASPSRDTGPIAPTTNYKV